MPFTEYGRNSVANAHDLAEWVHIDVLFQAYFHAYVILLVPPDTANPPRSRFGSLIAQESRIRDFDSWVGVGLAHAISNLKFLKGSMFGPRQSYGRSDPAPARLGEKSLRLRLQFLKCGVGPALVSGHGIRIAQPGQVRVYYLIDWPFAPRRLRPGTSPSAHNLLTVQLRHQRARHLLGDGIFYGEDAGERRIELFRP